MNTQKSSAAMRDGSGAEADIRTGFLQVQYVTIGFKSYHSLLLELQFVDQLIFGGAIEPSSQCTTNAFKAEMSARPLRCLVGSAHGY
jgi:hypothetical protein